MLNKFTKIKRTLLFSILLLIAGGLRAENVYLLTAQTINGTAGSYSDTISAHKFTLSSGTVYTYTITSLGTNSDLSAGGTFYFRIKVDGWSYEMQPYIDGDVLTINGDSYTITSDCYGNTKAWKVTVPASTYESITITVDLGDTKTVAVTGTASSETGSETTGSISAGDYYLVTNFVKGTDASGTSGDGTSINYNRLIFKFKQQTDGSYSVDIPATVTGHAQILGYDGTTKTIYGPSNTNVNYEVNSTWPDASNGVIPSSTTPGELTTGSTTLSEATNYWNFTTRNISGGDCDDGMYTINFTLSDGVPTNWTITHNAYKRVVYVVRADMSKPAQPLYDARTNSTDGFDNKFLGSVYMVNATNYYMLSNYTINDSYLSNAQTLDDTAVDPGNEAPTVNKLMLQGNGGNAWVQSNDYNLVYPNDSYFVTESTTTGVYILEYYPSKGKDGGIYGIGGELWLFSDAPTINSVSMVGTAISGTVTDDTWDYTSTVGDMTYNEDEHCYELILTTTADDGASTFRFVANHSATTTWGEEGTDDAYKARTPYDGTSTTGHVASLSDPNAVSYYSTDNTSTTDLNIIFNRPAGTWEVKFYIEVNHSGGSSVTYNYYYTINSVVPIDMHNLSGTLYRTFSYSKPLTLPNGLHAYIAYKFEQSSDADAINDNSGETSDGAIYLREISYIPANTGVLLKGTYDSNTMTLNGTTVTGAYNLTEHEAVTMSSKSDSLALYVNEHSDYHNMFTGYNELSKLTDNVEYVDGNVVDRLFAFSFYSFTDLYTSGETDYAGFFRLKKNSTIYANTAVLKICKSSSYGSMDFNGQSMSGSSESTDDVTTTAKVGLIFVEGDDIDATITGITEVNTEATTTGDDSYYNLQGVKVSKPTMGIYIHNGKKVIVK